MKKKLLSGVLVVCMLLSLLPTMAFAADTSADDPDHQHKYEFVKALRDATCTAEGIGQYKCSCGEKLYQAIPAGHKEPTDESAFTIVKDAECGTAGSKTYVCSGCGETVSVEIPATGKHKYEVKITDLTCTQPEKVVELCRFCDTQNPEGPDDVLKSALGHDYEAVESTENKTPTCTEAGAQVYVCKRGNNCDGKPDENGHGKTYTATVEELGHDWVDAEKVEATCTTAAGMKQTCRREGCNATQVVEFKEGEPGYEAAKNHTWVDAPPITMDCHGEGTPGRTGGKWCNVCHTLGTGAAGAEDEAPESVPVTHTPRDKVVEIEPTCAAEGSTRTDKVCSVCNALLETGTATSIPKLDTHGEEELTRTLRAATCTNAGIGQYKCKDCGTNLGYKTIEANGKHTKPDTDVVTVAATCETPGSETYSCTVCGEKVADVLEALGHDYENGETTYTAIINGTEVELTEAQVTDYTCVDKTKSVKCSRCDETEDTLLNHSTEHDMEEKTEQPDCTEPAESYSECTICGEATTKTPDLSTVKTHSFTVKDTESTENKAATCKETGIQVYKCSNDGCEVIEKRSTEKIAHTWDEELEQLVEADCEHAAGVRKTCGVCGETEVEEFTGDLAEPKRPHILTPHEAVSATCTKAGMEAHFTCSRPCCKDKLFVEDENAPGEYKEAEAEDLTIDKTEHVPGTETIEIKETIPGYEVKAVTCQEDGWYFTANRCENCNELVNVSKVDVTASADYHVLLDGRHLREADCATGTAGIARFSCDVCGTDMGYKTLPAMHSYQVLGSDGERVLMDPEATPDATKSTEPTCTQEGSYVYTCTNEGCTNDTSSDPVEVPMKDHEWEKKETTAPTCLLPAVSGYVCKNCGVVDEERSDVTAVATGHNMVVDATESTDATCQAAGKKVSYCSNPNCDGGEDGKPHREEEVISQLEHNWINTGMVDPTCTEDAKVSEKCENCPETRTRAFDEDEKAELGALVVATGHDPRLTAIEVPATCTATGTKAIYTCANEGCNTKFIEDEDDPGEYVEVTDDDMLVIAKMAHTPSSTPEVEVTTAPTCSSDGEETTTTKCTVCGTVTSTTTRVVPADSTKHVKDEGNVLRKMSCAAGTAGIVQYTCTVCGDELEYETIPAHHSFEKYDEETKTYKPDETLKDASSEAATCLKDGTDVYKCEECVKSYSYPVEKLQHNYPDPTEADRPEDKPECETCTVEVTCTNGCGATMIKTLLGVSHDYEEKTIPATCTAPAMRGEVCKYCNTPKDSGAMTPVVGSEPTGHTTNATTKLTETEIEAAITSGDIDETEYTPATCTQDGKEAHRCAVCKEIVLVEVKASGHDYDYDNGKDEGPTCMDGRIYFVVKCKNCEDVHKELLGGKLGDINPDGHVLTRVPGVDATCTTDGAKEHWKCEACSKKFSDAAGTTEIVATEEDDGIAIKAQHTYEVTSTTEATCTAAATETKTCSVCSDTMTDAVGTALGHTIYDEDLSKNDTWAKAKCTTGTVSVSDFTCSRCKAEITVADNVTLNLKKEHKYDDGEETLPATCTNEGVKTFTCQNDGCVAEDTGHSYTEEIDALGHTYEEPALPSDWPECKDYLAPVHCSKCNQDVEVTIEGDSSKHNYESVAIDSAAKADQYGKEDYDCTKEIYAGRFCTKCNAEETKEDGTTTGKPVPGTAAYTAHDWVNEAGDDFDCTNTDPNSTYTRKCSRCTIEETKNGTGKHDVEGVEATIEAATCTEDAKEIRICKVCNKPVETKQSNTATGHHKTETATVPETCYKKALEYTFCPDCLRFDQDKGELVALVAGAEIDSAAYDVDEEKDGSAKSDPDHLWGDWVTTKDPTCTETGLKSRGCTRCEEKEENVSIEALGHVEVVGTPVAPTCNTEGYTPVTCDRCKEEIRKDNVVPSNPDLHDWKYNEDLNSPDWIRKPTCTKTGVIQATCNNCNTKKYINGLPALGHIDEVTVTKAATCTEDGIKVTTCSRPGCTDDYEVVEVIPAYGHDWVYDRREGVYTCPDCGAQSEDGENALEEASVINVEEALDTEAPAEEIPDVNDPAEEIPDVNDPAEEIPDVNDPAEETPNENDPAEETPNENDPAEETPNEEDPAEETPNEDDSAEETPNEDEPAEEPSVEESSTEEASIEE